MWNAPALPSHEGGGHSSLDPCHGPSLFSTPTGGFQNLHCFEKGIVVKVQAGTVSRDSQEEAEPVNRQCRELVARAEGLSSPWGASGCAAGRCRQREAKWQAAHCSG